ncbi:MAG TPA: hypothetical protein VIU13_08525, partial [Chryseolinea sp.]
NSETRMTFNHVRIDSSFLTALLLTAHCSMLFAKLSKTHFIHTTFYAFCALLCAKITREQNDGIYLC